MTEPYPTVSATPRPNHRHHWHRCHDCCYEITYPPTQPRPLACPYCHANWIPPKHLRVELQDWWSETVKPVAIRLGFYTFCALSLFLTFIGLAHFLAH